MQPGFIAGAGPTPHALHTAYVDVAAVTAVSGVASIKIGDSVDPRPRREPKASTPRFPVIRGILFALPISVLFWVGVLVLSVG